MLIHLVRSFTGLSSLERLDDALAHLARGTAREGEREDPFGRIDSA
jgi:hypothetical protein